MKHVDIVPDWVIAVLAAFTVMGTFWIFGGSGVLVLAMTGTTVWIAQTFGGH